MAQQRKTLIVARRVQMALLVQAVTHWLLFTGVAFLVLFFWHVLSHGFDKSWLSHLRAVWLHSGTTFVILICLLPVVIWDSFRLSNRVAGPIFRLQRAVQALARGETAAPVKFREKDFWHDLAEDFNAVTARLRAAGAEESQPTQVTR